MWTCSGSGSLMISRSSESPSSLSLALCLSPQLLACCSTLQPSRLLSAYANTLTGLCADPLRMQGTGALAWRHNSSMAPDCAEYSCGHVLSTSSAAVSSMSHG